MKNFPSTENFYNLLLFNFYSLILFYVCLQCTKKSIGIYPEWQRFCTFLYLKNKIWIKLECRNIQFNSSSTVLFASLFIKYLWIWYLLDIYGLDIWQMQVKATMRHHFMHPLGWLSSKKTDKNECWWGCGETRASCIAGGKVKCWRQFGNSSAVPKKV